MGIFHERQKLISRNSRPWLYLVTHCQNFSNPSIQLKIIAAAAQAGCQLIQIREKDWSASNLFEFTYAAISVARPHGAKILVNDRLDVALAAGADGVHLPANSLTAEDVRKIVSDPDFLIGVSTHSMGEVELAKSEDADFVVCGPVFSTPSKVKYGEPMGLEKFSEICAKAELPVLGLGGISTTNFSEVISCGAAGIAGIGLFQNPDALATNIKMMLSSKNQPQD